MVSPKKIHQWLMKALEEPFFRAEMYRAEILLKNSRNRGRDRQEELKTDDHQEKDSEVTTLSGKIFSH
ncbi:MAG: hypothetical protein AB1523_11355 [Bacillota bacterium]